MQKRKALFVSLLSFCSFILTFGPMKHLPNLLTLGNLFSGCLAMAYILTAQPYVYRSVTDHSLQWIMGTEQMYMGSIFIGLAALFDMLDGFAARALNVFSPIGKDLDSLADVVSFGAAPSMIMFKCLWDARMQQFNAMDASMLSMAPAFLIGCFAALRLAKFNITASAQKNYFIGMPVPAVGILIGSFPIVLWNNTANAPAFLHNTWFLYAVIALVCFLMVSKIKFFKMIPPKMKLAYAWPQLVVIATALGAIPFAGFAALPIAFLMYILLSLVYKYPEEQVATA